MAILEGAPARRTVGGDIIALVFFVGLCLAVGALGGVWTAESVRTWYPTLAKPPINPPNWVFGPVWTVLYIAMGFAALRVWRHSGLRRARWALAVFAVQLGLNLAWSYLFFGRHLIGAALIDIMLLLAAIVATALLFARHDRVAAWLMVPYGAWVAYASVLNGWIWALNRA